ncbi:hypothetical protein MHU86_8038 [Fragilaria crotonensis]|nr:hypothetical protein MHU86_8038 [Fragilaria crotonensis]
MCQPQSSDIYLETDQVVKYQDIPNEAVPVTVVHTSEACWEVIYRCEAIYNAPRVDWSTFHSFIESLEPWETDLLRCTRLYVDPRLAVMELQDNFQAGSDGSSKYGKQGAFGWSVRTMVGETSADGSGPSRGATVDSHRAECSGMLAFLRFLIRIAEYTDMFEPWVGRIGTDSQSMLDRLFGKQDESTMDSKEYKVSSLRSLDVLDPEWDLLNEIQITLRFLPDVTLEYVKGHQDDHTEYLQLSLMAQLNVDADSLATGYQQEVGRMFPQVLMSANAGAYLVVDEGTVTNKMVQKVRYLATGPSLRKYIMKKNNWDETVMRSINWKAHAKFMKSQVARRVHFSKLIHECLPTHSLRNRFDSGRRTCPSCPSANETRDHILRCSGPSRVDWRDYFLRRLERFHVQENTSPFLAHLLREALSQWFQEADSDITVSPIFSSRLMFVM